MADQDMSECCDSATYYLSQEDYISFISKDSRVTYSEPRNEFVRVGIDTPLYKQLLLDYYQEISIVPVLFNPALEREEDRRRRETDTTKTRTYLYAEEGANGRPEVEVHLSTIARAFAVMGIRSKKQIEARSSSAIDRNMGEEDNTPSMLYMRALSRFPDTFLVYRDSHAIVSALKRESNKPADARTDPRAICSKMYLDSDEALSRPDDCVLVQQHRIWMNEKLERQNGFMGGFSPLGVCGKGVGFGIASASKLTPKNFLLIINLMGPEPPTARITRDANQEPSPGDIAMNDVQEVNDPLALESKKVFLTLDVNSVYPVWYSVPKARAPAEVLRVAVSAQRRYNEHAYAACIGRPQLPTNPEAAADRCALYVYVAQIDESGKANHNRVWTLVDDNPPCNPAVPNFIVLSSRLVVLVMTDASCGGQRCPPHMYIRAYTWSADTELEWLGPWEPFAIELPPRSDTDPPPKFYEDLLEKGEMQCITAGAFDAYDAGELTLGSYDGLLLTYRVYRDESGVLQCQRRQQTPFITPSYAESLRVIRDMIARANGKLTEEQQRALIDSVGVMRSPILSIHSSYGTHEGRGGPDVWWAEPCAREMWEDRAAFRITCGHATGFAWQLGDAATVTMLKSKRICSSGMQTGSALRSVYSFGRVLAINDFDTNYIHLFHISSNMPVGSIGLETKKPMARDMTQLFQSLWMDVGRIALLYADGDVAIVVPASAEALAERDRLRKAREASMREKKAKQLKELEETASKMASMSIQDNDITRCNSESLKKMSSKEDTASSK